ncbi:MAG TPA: zinc-binding dehydrogenase [Anaerolineaceae bacterium]|nr:zinc-binding dehydrogenase [Anaerolineaceae bacterium]
MKGAAAVKPGEVMLVDFPEPKAAGDDLVIAALACGICSTDLKLVQRGADGPRYALGHELVGRVLQVPDGGSWKVGQRVALAPYLPCGKCFFCQRGQLTLCSNLYDIYPTPGGLAERVLAPAELAARGLITIPDALGDELAALAEPLGCVLKALEDSRLRPGDSFLVVGDGPMGQLSAAAGKALGARPVIVAGMTPHRLAVAENHFADLTVNVSQEDLQQTVLQATSQRGADVVIVAVSSGEALEEGIDCVRPGGEVNMFAGVPHGTKIPLDVRKVHYKQYRLTGSFGTAPVYMRRAIDLLHTGGVDFSPVISARFPFDQVADAIRYMQDYVGLKSMVLFPQSGGQLE